MLYASSTDRLGGLVSLFEWIDLVARHQANTSGSEL